MENKLATYRKCVAIIMPDIKCGSTQGINFSLCVFILTDRQ